MLSTAVSTFGQNLSKVRRLILVAFAEWGHPVFGNINNVQPLQQPGQLDLSMDASQSAQLATSIS